MTEPVETAELLAFAKTVSTKSVSRAARELGVPRATIGRRLARLEQRLGTRLLRRTTRSMVLTDAGETLYRHAAIVLDAVARAEASVSTRDDTIRGELRVSIPGMMPKSFVLFVCDFAQRHPEVRLQMHASNRRVDLIREGYDIALRAGVKLEPGLVARTLATSPAIAVAAPTYVRKHGEPKTRRELAGHACLMGFQAGELAQTHWPFADGGSYQVPGVFASNDLELLCAAALRGLGIALLPLQLVAPHIAAGRLLHVMPTIMRIESKLSLVYAERELMAPQVRAFIDAVIAWAPKGLDFTLPARCDEHGAKPRPKRRR